MRPFAYARPETIDEAIALLNADSRLLAGGTDLLTLMKGDIVAPDHLIDIKRLPDLDDRIELVEDALSIGALSTLAQLDTDPLIRQHLPALAEAAAVAATPQLRNMATIGGNVLQRPRCWYYRNDDVHCWLKGGDECYAREGDNRYHALFGESQCVAVHPSDLASVLVAYEATVHFRDTGGVREIGIETFFQEPTPERRTEHALPEHAVITRITVPMTADGTRSTYLKAMDRKVWAFALVGVAAVIELDAGVVRNARIVLGGVATVPWRVPAAERSLIGARANEETFAQAAEIAAAEAVALSHNGYKVPLLKALVRRALAEAGV
jgi:xanthine dehydrogenase YagS FAD-binding subunit